MTAFPAHAQYSADREPPGPSSRKTGLAITEIMYNPRPVQGQSTNVTLEFIEIFNSKPWAEDISGFSIDGLVRYVFPSNTVLDAGGYVVVARYPGLVITNYAITNVVGPWIGATTNRLSTERGLVQLKNRQGGVLLAINYQDSPPWPEAADGTGHSLVLARPSYGEDDFRAWSESDLVGGSPGGADATPNDSLGNIFINEWQNHSDPSDWIELYNHSTVPVDLSGAWLSDDPKTNKYRIANGTTIPARGFLTWDQNQLGFELFAGGETIFLWNSNQTRVIDVIDFQGSSNNVSQGRWPDGGPYVYGMAANSSSRGLPNPKPIRYGVVISEIMYNPISGNSDDEYVEIHNRGNQPVNLAEWEFVTGISYLFSNSPIMMPPGAYWVMAKNPTNLFATYSHLNTNNTFGPYGGTLANGGERLALAAADYDLVGLPGMQTNERLPVVVSDLVYGDGGKWGDWADGLGSSLELIDVEGDVHLPSNWADSSDVLESQWTAIEATIPLGESLGSPINDSLIVGLQGIGECLVDELEVRADGGPNLVANGGFEAGLSSWSLQGSHDFSTIENEGFVGTKSLHVRAGSRGDNQSNRILSAPFASAIPPGVTSVSLRAKVKWLRGHPEILLRLHGSATEAYGRMALPRKLGSPGLVNSRNVTNAGPAIHTVKHKPILPAASEPVVVSALVFDRQTITSMTLRYRVDPTPTYTGVTMRDDGTGGDAVAGDGIYSATIPGQEAGNMVAFYVEGRDSQNAIGTFPQYVFPPAGLTRCWPNDAVARECLVRWGETQMPGDFATYHLWVSAVNSNRWHTRAAQNNTSMDGTFVYNNSRAIYNAEPLYSGSPWHRTNSTTGPAGPNRVDYEMNFPADDALLGTTDFVLNNPGNPDILTISDLSALAEQTVYKIFEGLGVVYNHRRYIHFFVNGSQRSKAYERAGNFIFEDSQQPNGDMIGQWFPNDAGGQLFKVEDWFEFANNGFDVTANNDGDLARRTTMINGQPTQVPGPYRFMFRKRSVNVGNSANDFSPIYSLIDAVSPPENPTNTVIDPDLFSTVADWEAWMRHFAVQRAVGNWDSYGWERGKNDYLYRATTGFVHMPWDIDYSLGLGRPANEPLFASNDPRVTAMFNTPAIVRAYWRAFADLAAGPLSNANLDPFIAARVAALVTNNINIDLAAVAAIKTYIGDRRAFLLSQLATVNVPFALDGPMDFDTADNLVFITGTAPVGVKFIRVNGVDYPVTWTSATRFLIRVVVTPGLNAIAVSGFDRSGATVPGALASVNVTYTGPVVQPVGSLFITELMHSPTNGGQFIEIVNRSAQNFDLSGWRVDGINFQFGLGSIVTNGQTTVLAQNKNAFLAAYGNRPIFATFTSSLLRAGQVLALVRPTAAGDELIDGLRYKNDAPWPQGTNGLSLQLIDATQENSRSPNWAVGLPTPGATNSVAGVLQPFDPLWLNELQIANLQGFVDEFSESDPWIELHNSGALPVSLDGYFLATSLSSNLTEWPFPPGTAIAPGGHLLLWADGQPTQTGGTNLHTSFRLDFTGDLALVRLVAGQPQIVDYLTWSRVGANLSYGSILDGQSVYRDTLHRPSPRTTNSEPAPAVFINEWMAANSTGIRDPADMAQDDWFELFNAGGQTVDLSGYYLTDTFGQPTKYRVPTNGQYRIAPRSFLLVFADNQIAQNTAARSNLHTNFKLSSSPGFIGLYRPDGITPVDEVSYAQQVDNVSEGRYSDGATNRYSFIVKSTPSGPNSITNIYNSPPAFPPLADLTALPGQVVTVTIRASDPDGNALAYNILTAPPGSQLNQGGLFRWTVPVNQPPGDFPVMLRVTDNGVPARSDTASFMFTVPGGPGGTPINAGPVVYSIAAINSHAVFTINTLVGRTYRLLYKDDLSSTAWSQLDRDFVAANATASITDYMLVPVRFYQILQLD